MENVGNLVCPALFDLGEWAKVVILSVTEGEDKPLKYPHMFRAAQLMLLNKVDLLPYLQFDLERCLKSSPGDQPYSEDFTGLCDNRRRNGGVVRLGSTAAGKFAKSCFGSLLKQVIQAFQGSPNSLEIIFYESPKHRWQPKPE